MSVDKNVFMYNLSVVAIMKNEGPYIKEWLDYHLLAGVEHFYIYDNDSTDNTKEILQPYIEKNIVTYIFCPGKCRQIECYNEAMSNFKFYCRYIAFIDADEFIFPQSDRSIVEVLDEIIGQRKNVGGIGINWVLYGDNYQSKADYNQGVLERFKRRKRKFQTSEDLVKVVVNPRYVDYTQGSHQVTYFLDTYTINEEGNIIPWDFSPLSVNKILINHYSTKTWEEFEQKIKKGNADYLTSIYDKKRFKQMNFNDEFDDSILAYREVRKNKLVTAPPRKTL